MERSNAEKADDSCPSTICQAELAARILETVNQDKRPRGCSATEFLHSFKDTENEGAVDDCVAAAGTAIQYFRECVALVETLAANRGETHHEADRPSLH
jgi:hypothetical protein